MREEAGPKCWIHIAFAERKTWSILLVAKGFIKEVIEEMMLALNPGR